MRIYATKSLSIVNKGDPILSGSRDKTNMVTGHCDTHALRQPGDAASPSGTPQSGSSSPLSRESCHSETPLCNHVRAFVEVRATPSTLEFLRSFRSVFQDRSQDDPPKRRANHFQFHKKTKKRTHKDVPFLTYSCSLRNQQNGFICICLSLVNVKFLTL